jgi:hypothetical protein
MTTTTDTTTRKSPAKSGKAKLRWDGDKAMAVINGVKVNVGKRVKQVDGTYKATVLDAGKWTTLGSKYSKDGAYYVVTHWYHWGTVPAKPAAKPAASKRAVKPAATVPATTVPATTTPADTTPAVPATVPANLPAMSTV